MSATAIYWVGFIGMIIPMLGAAFFVKGFGSKAEGCWRALVASIVWPCVVSVVAAMSIIERMEEIKPSPDKPSPKQSEQDN